MSTIVIEGGLALVLLLNVMEVFVVVVVIVIKCSWSLQLRSVALQ